MSEKTVRGLAAAAGLLVLAWVATTVGGDGLGEAPPVSRDVGAFFEGLAPASVDSVRLAGPGGARVLARRDGVWKVDGLRTDSATVARFWTAVEDAEVAELVARNARNHGRMGVAEEEAYSLTVYLEGEARTLLVGDAGGGFATAFVRLPGEDEVHLVRGELRSHLTRSLSDWRDKRVAAIDTARVSAVVLAVGGSEYRLARRDSAWTLGDADAASAPVRDLLAELATLRATGFVEDSDSLASLPEAGSVIALSAAGDTLALLRIGQGDGDRWARTRGDETLYRLPTWRAERLLPDPDGLRGG